MNNRERKDYLLHVAEKKYEEMKRSWKESDWNMVIRNAQEAIEFYLKATFKYMNIEIPKEHDIGKYFEKILIERNIQYDKNTLEKIKILSKELADKRAPAYYGEEFYSQDEAERAKEGAEFVKIYIKYFLKKLGT